MVCVLPLQQDSVFQRVNSRLYGFHLSPAHYFPERIFIDVLCSFIYLFIHLLFLLIFLPLFYAISDSTTRITFCRFSSHAFLHHLLFAILLFLTIFSPLTIIFRQFNSSDAFFFRSAHASSFSQTLFYPAEQQHSQSFHYFFFQWSISCIFFAYLSFIFHCFTPAQKRFPEIHYWRMFQSLFFPQERKKRGRQEGRENGSKWHEEK